MRPSDGCRHDVGGWASTGRAVALVETLISVALTSHAPARGYRTRIDLPPGHMPARTP
jgi:hypothetical protein